MSRPSHAEEGLTQRQADILGRQFNSALTNANAYGAEHPLTERTGRMLLETLSALLEQHGDLVLMLDRGRLYIEDLSLDGKFNSRRVTMIFRELGLQSIQFRPGVDETAIERLMQALADHGRFEDVDGVRAALAEDGIDSIRINHVVMRKFTEEDEVISREGLRDLSGLAERALAPGRNRDGGGGPIAGELADRVEQILTMRELVDHPDRVAEHVVTMTSSDRARRAGLVEEIRKLRQEVAEADRSDVSLAEVMDALAQVRGELSDALAGQDELARLLAENGGDALNEVDQLTFDTVLAIMRDEYRGGTTSSKRLAQILRRVLPDSRDIKRFVPLLKQGLMEEGMPLDDYLRFVNELGAELRGDDLVGALQRGAEHVGLSVEELVASIRRDPSEAARLLVLATETGNDDKQLSAILADYIERASGELVADGMEGASARELRDAVRSTQSRLLQEIRVHGVADAVRVEVERNLADRVDRTVGQARAGKLTRMLRDSGADDEAAVVDTLEHFVSRSAELKTLGNTIRAELESIGYSEDVIDRIYAQTERRLRGRSRVELLPGGMLEPNVLAYLLEREIASGRRHGTYFSCILLMVARIREDADEAKWRAIQPKEVEQIVPQVFRELPPYVRDVDLLGSLGSKSRNIPLVLLTMTRDEGAQTVLERILGGLDSHRFECEGQPVRVRTIGVAECFSADRTPDRKSYLKGMQARLANELVSHLHAPDGKSKKSADATGERR